MVFSHTEILSNIHQNGTTPQVLKTDQVEVLESFFVVGS